MTSYSPDTRFDQMRDETPVYGEPIPEDKALVFIGGEFDGWTTGTARGHNPYAARKAWLGKVGINPEFTSYMARAKQGLTVAPALIDTPGPTDWHQNFHEVWPSDFQGHIHDPKLAESAAHAMKEPWEAAMEQEQLAAANRNAILFGEGVLEIMSEEGKGLLVGPFLTRMEHGMAESTAGLHYEQAHFAGARALETALDS